MYNLLFDQLHFYLFFVFFVFSCPNTVAEYILKPLTPTHFKFSCIFYEMASGNILESM